MKCRHFHITLLLFLLIFCRCFSQVLPAERSTSWTNAGLSGIIPVYTTTVNITDHGGNGNDAAANDVALQNAMNSLNGQSGIIYFPPGTYLFNQPISMLPNIVLKGAGAATTMLRFNLGGNSSLINIFGTGTNITTNIIATAIKGATYVQINDASQFAVNDHIKIFQNDAQLVNDGFALESVAQIVKIDSIQNNRIYFSKPLRRSFKLTDTPRVRKLQMIQGCGIECLKIKRMDPSIQQTSNVRFNNAANCWIRGVESDSCNFAHIQIANSSNIEIANSYFHGAFAYGGGGQGYGVACESSSGQCLIENNSFRHLRHSMLLQSGANGNVFAYNYSTEPFNTDTLPYNLSGDIVLHGNYPYLNLFEGNIVQNILVDASHGKNGPFNTFFRNRAELYGLFIAANVGDSTNIIGNEITGSGPLQGNYYTPGLGLFHYANNKNDTIIPPGTNLLTDRSLYHTSTPSFWNSSYNWAGIGPPYEASENSIPAKERSIPGQEIAYCLPLVPLTYTFNGNGNWSNAANWVNNFKPPTILSPGSEIIVDPQTGGKCTLDIPYVIQPGIGFTVRPTKNFEVISKLLFVK